MKIPLSHQTKQAGIPNALLSLATERGPDKSTCPSEIARLLFPQDWRNQMKAVRDVAIDLHKQGKVIITQKGKPVDIDGIKGPIRIKIV
ncbi:DUF3253 domain-containing protein [Pedobacter sp. WC2501]|uniref:DUF3253 domain-containing protein n=1 Tax=Pedobacter sp. WC2501 TaxID=3461400 RepID=UPI004045930E